MRAAEWALIALLLGLILSATVLLFRPGAREAVFGLSPAVQATEGQGGPGLLPSPGRR